MIKKYLLMMTALVLLLASCEDPQEEIVPEIKVPAESQEVFTSGIQFESMEDPAQPGQPSESQVQTTQIQFTATDKWTADVVETKASNWLSVQPSSGNAGDVTMKVIAQPNTGSTPRSASVNLKCGTVTKSFKVSQAGFVPPVIDVTGITLSADQLTMIESETATLTATVKPDDATDKTVTWSTDNDKVATVKDGIVTAIAEGTAIITAAAGAFSATCRVAVSKRYIAVTSVTLDQTVLTLVKGASATLNATVAPTDATNPAVTWASSDESVASVKNGVVTAIKSGRATITATADNKSATCAVTVSNPATGIKLDKNTAVLTEGETTTLTATVEPADADDKTVTWSSSKPNVATVDNAGKVTAVAEGVTEITAKCGNLTAVCAVTVNKLVVPVSSVELDKTSLALNKGEFAYLTATVKPDNATDKTVSWSSNNPNVATVDYTGKVVAVAGGTATITASAGGKTATCAVTVSVPVTSVGLSQYSVTIAKGESVNLAATVEPSDADDKTVTWRTSDASVATVADGKVTAVKSGSATITATAGGKSATCAVTVVTPVKGIKLDKAGVALTEGENVTLTATVEPADADDKTVAWASSNDNVASVDANGKVTAHTEGSAIVSATCGGFTATCAVTVAKLIIPVTSVTLDKTSAELKEGETVTLTATVKPDDATNKTVTWSSSNTAVATVVDGVVTAVKAGTATITAACGNFSATCAVTVEAPFVPVTSISLNRTELSMLEGEWYTLTVTFNPSNATDKSVTWSTSDASVAKLIGPGKIEAGKPGTATITAECGGKIATCTVTVKDPPVAVTGISIPEHIDLHVGETVTIEITFTPENAEPMGTASWRWWGEEYATSQKDDYSITLTGVAFGGAYLYVDCCGFSAACEVYVRAAEVPIESVTLSETSLTLDPLQEYYLTATVNPPGAGSGVVKWSTSDDDVAIVGIEDGKILALAPGTCTISGWCGGIHGDCELTVTSNYPVYSFNLDIIKLQTPAGNTWTFHPMIQPEEAAAYYPVTYSSSNPSVVSVDENGNAVAHKGGSATITATCHGLTSTCEVSVNTVLNDIIFDKTEINLPVGESYTLGVSFDPADPGEVTLEWESDNPEVATVQNGVITGVKMGVATIAARAAGKFAYCTVTVTGTAGGGGFEDVTDEPIE